MPAKELAVQWQGRKQDIEEIQHLLYAFKPTVLTAGNILAIRFDEGKPVFLGMGDWAVLNEFDQFMVRPEEKK